MSNPTHADPEPDHSIPYDGCSCGDPFCEGCHEDPGPCDDPSPATPFELEAPRTAESIADAIRANVAWLNGGGSWSEFDAQQRRLWDEAKAHGLSDAVARIVSPPLLPGASAAIDRAARKASERILASIQKRRREGRQ